MIASRRSFLIGLGAVIAAVKIPLVMPADALQIAQPAILPDILARRAVVEITMGSADEPTLDEIVRCQLFRDRMEQPLLDLSMHSRGCLRWGSVPTDPTTELIFLPESPMRIEMARCDTAMRISMVSRPLDAALKRNGPLFVENYTWEGNKLVKDQCLCVDSSWNAAA
jgi:hypothetical protein